MAKMTIEGSFVALITPFNADGSVDFGAFRTLLRFQEDHGTAAVLFMGSTGEPTMLTPEERRQVVVETARMKTGRMRFFYGCTGGSTEATIAHVRFAREHGADGAILAAPPYICASEDDIERFFLEVADATDLPLGIYNNPPRVGTDLGWERLLRVLSHPRYVVHKESTANVAPAEMAALSRPWRRWEDAAAFRETYLRLLPLLHFTYSATNPVPVKSLMKALGLPAGGLRRPLRALEGPGGGGGGGGGGGCGAGAQRPKTHRVWGGAPGWGGGAPSAWGLGGAR